MNFSNSLTRRVFLLKSSVALAAVAWAYPAFAQDVTEDTGDQAEWVQSYDAATSKTLDRSTAPLLSPGTLAATEAAIEAIIDGLDWLGLTWDGDTIYQFARAKRHAEVALDLLAQGKAYKCYATAEELTEMRDLARKEGRPPRYDGRWRDLGGNERRPDHPPASGARCWQWRHGRRRRCSRGP